jgi:hypothetical protein
MCDLQRSAFIHLLGTVLRYLLDEPIMSVVLETKDPMLVIWFLDKKHALKQFSSIHHNISLSAFYKASHYSWACPNNRDFLYITPNY